MRDLCEERPVIQGYLAHLHRMTGFSTDSALRSGWAVAILEKLQPGAKQHGGYGSNGK
jgi:hypothetical protein